MKKFYVILILLSFCVVSFAQNVQTKVTLKNGVELTGVMKSFDPATAIVLEIGGMESTIKMEDVQSVSKVETAAPAETASAAPASKTANLPKEKTVNIAGVDVKFVLCEGGTFTYGYEDRGSLAIESEPVHEITLSPFYVSCEPVSRKLVEAVTGLNPYDNYKFIYDAKKAENFDLSFDYLVGFDKPDESKIPEVAFFNGARKSTDYLLCTKEMKIVEDFPITTEFIDAIRDKGIDKIDMLDEAQWACIKHFRDKAVNFPLNPELVYSIDMNDKINPQKVKIMHKGRPRTFGMGFAGRIEISDYHNRGLMNAHKLDEKKKVIEMYEIRSHLAYKADWGGKYSIAPMHLVFPAE